MANLTSVQYFAFTVTPILGAILSAFIETKQCNLHFHNASIAVNSFTIPVLFLSFLTVFCIFLLCAFFVDIRRWHGIDRERLPFNTNDGKETSTVGAQLWMGVSLDTRVAIGGCLLNMATKGTIGVFETLGSELVTTHYNWSSVRTGYTFAIFGAVGVISLLSFRVFINLFGDVNLILFGISLMIVSCIIMTQMHDTSADIWFYGGLVLMYSIGYPLGHTAVLAVVSKITNIGPQGKLLGYFGSAGSLARVIFPLLAGFLSQIFDEQIIFFIMIFVLSVSFVMLLLCRESVNKVIL